MQQVLKTTTSATSMSSVATNPSATSAPASRSESWSFIWHPKVRMWNVRGGGRPSGSSPATPSVVTHTGYGSRPVRPVPGTRSGVRGLHHRVDTSPDQPVTGHRDPPGSNGRHQVVEDPVGHGLVEGALAAEAPQIELER